MSLTLEALAVNKNIDFLKRQIAEFRPRKIAVGDEEAGKKIKKIGARDIHYGIEGLNKIASDKDVDIVVIGLKRLCRPASAFGGNQGG